MRLLDFSEANCKNCYKCVRGCPVKAIRFRGSQAEIDEQRCIACGKCFVICPQNARNIVSDTMKVKQAIAIGKQVKALIAPSFAGFYRNRGGFLTALRKLGFSEIIEVAAGAEMVTDRYRRFMEENDPKYAISSCCPTVYMYMRRYSPTTAEYLMPVVSPMLATGKAVKRDDKDCFTVFIGPCLSKKCEMVSYGNEGIIDAVLTLEEISHLLSEEGLDPEVLEPSVPDVTAGKKGRRYPVAGGIAEGLSGTIDRMGYDVIRVEGMTEVREVLKEIEDGTLDKAYIELSACSESCIGGPCVPEDPLPVFARKQNVKRFSVMGWESEGRILLDGKIDISGTYAPTPIISREYPESEIAATLARMGKFSKGDELNCSACGYNSCRDKAKAVLEGMSEVEMCLPFMRTKAEHMSDIIFSNSPNYIFLLDEELCIHQMNPSAEIVFGRRIDEIRGFPISYVADDAVFEAVARSKRSSLNKRTVYDEYGIVVVQSTVFLDSSNQLLVIMSDITDEEKRRDELQSMKERTLKIAQKVIDRQMTAAHEIASLLGETTAETKIALDKLKELVLMEGE